MTLEGSRKRRGESYVSRIGQGTMKAPRMELFSCFTPMALYQNPQFYYPLATNATGPGLGGERSNGNFNGVSGGSRDPLTSLQLLELENQAFIYRCLAAGLPVPSTLLQSLSDLNLLGGSLSTVGGGSLFTFGGGQVRSGYAGNREAEPGRCRRTDGKKWRCPKEVVPGQKYCENHVNRGRRSRKPVGTQARQAASSRASSTTSRRFQVRRNSPSQAFFSRPSVQPNIGRGMFRFPQRDLLSVPSVNFGFNPNSPAMELPSPTFNLGYNTMPGILFNDQRAASFQSRNLTPNLNMMPNLLDLAPSAPMQAPTLSNSMDDYFSLSSFFTGLSLYPPSVSSGSNTDQTEITVSNGYTDQTSSSNDQANWFLTDSIGGGGPLGEMLNSSFGWRSYTPGESSTMNLMNENSESVSSPTAVILTNIDSEAYSSNGSSQT
ncbi:hypothetical protein AMTR_s00006p00257830 [Amborella trichopoda]|uniref:Growth-regulating factor n=2 Tax=Amborella trichopoda TaxID=13333 RepID=W1PDM5_AMBTC|nr:hypothetical protein AMTR_s00006p00257830 [Amborella trichopoda]